MKQPSKFSPAGRARVGRPEEEHRGEYPSSQVVMGTLGGLMKS